MAVAYQHLNQEEQIGIVPHGAPVRLQELHVCIAQAELVAVLVLQPRPGRDPLPGKGACARSDCCRYVRAHILRTVRILLHSFLFQSRLELVVSCA